MCPAGEPAASPEAENLEAKRDEVIARWGTHLYRRFVLYLWSAANSFENGTLRAHQHDPSTAVSGQRPASSSGVLVVSEPPATASAFEVAPYTPGEVRFHVTGAALNGAVLLGGMVWLFATWRERAPAWPWALVAIFAGVYAADLVSGLLHWAFDTWFDEDIAFLRRMTLQVREHHVYPNRIFRISVLHDAGTLSWIALILTGPLVLGVIAAGGAGRPPAMRSWRGPSSAFSWSPCWRSTSAGTAPASRAGFACCRGAVSCSRWPTTASITSGTMTSTTA